MHNYILIQCTLVLCDYFFVSLVCRDGSTLIYLRVKFPKRYDAGNYTLVASVPHMSTSIDMELIVECKYMNSET